MIRSPPQERGRQLRCGPIAEPPADLDKALGPPADLDKFDV